MLSVFVYTYQRLIGLSLIDIQEDSWEVEGARKRAKESRQQEKGGSPPSRKEREKKGKKEKEKKVTVKHTVFEHEIQRFGTISG